MNLNVPFRMNNQATQALPSLNKRKCWQAPYSKGSSNPRVGIAPHAVSCTRIVDSVHRVIAAERLERAKFLTFCRLWVSFGWCPHRISAGTPTMLRNISWFFSVLPSILLHSTCHFSIRFINIYVGAMFISFNMFNIF
jgi:hypothetical protein